MPPLGIYYSTKVMNLLPPGPRTYRKRQLRGGGEWGQGTLTSVFYSSEMSSQRKGKGDGKASPIPKFGIFNARGCSTNEVKKGRDRKKCF